MPLPHKFLRFSVVLALLGSLSACVVAPAQPVGYRGPAVYVETYPTYRYGHPNAYYDGYDDRRYYDDRGGRRYRDERRYEEPRRREATIPSPFQVHRDVRRSLGLPRLPGMP